MSHASNPLAQADTPSPLTEVLAGIRLSRSFYCESRLRAPWGFENPAYPMALFHFVMRGQVWWSREGAAPLALRQGDMALIPHGHAHRLSDTIHGPVIPAEQIPRILLGENASCMTAGGDGEESLLICGGMHLEPAWHPLIGALPPVIVLRGQSEQASRWLAPLLSLLRDEGGAGHAGAEAMITRLLEVLVIATLRVWIETAEVGSSGWLVAVRDPQLGRAIGAIHDQPHHPWSLRDLASKAGMSRSVFADRFAACCGMPPVQYVTYCRMNTAGDWLKQTSLPIAEVASRLGYSSEATFNRAFKRSWGIPPGRFREAPLSAHPLRGVE
ncbi:AraC family transcriptional regulator [Myxococcota bacterium]|nr:AraC family transcriptional regulator [Myxococcota bacterium]MBU1430234.1 AraC family transcriptional regulator [Myxococcota bacterium]MBU1898344.1 AraC family transcriptional regulator [Myxococcota bacterium]